MKTVLITGANGALGRAVYSRFSADPDCNVVIAGRQQHGHPLDLRKSPDFKSLLEKTRPHWILHLAATFLNEFEEAYAVNVEASRLLLEAVQELGAECRVVLVGSAAEYGPVRPEENPIREDRALGPMSVYGLSKAWQTQLAHLYASRGVDVMVARLFNLAAPGLSERLFVGRVQKQIQEVLDGKRTELELGPLTATRDYVGADEAVEQLIAIAECGQSGQVYNVASGTPITMRELLRNMLATDGLEHVPVREAEALSNRAGFDVPAIYADLTKTRQLLQRRTQSAAS